MTRQDFTQIPEVQEIETILNKEAKRPIATGKENIHYANFDLFYKWLDMAGVSTELIKTNAPWQELVVLAHEAQKQTLEKTLQWISEDNHAWKNLAAEIYDYLGEENTPQSSDAIFVYGSASPLRIEKAVELYKKNLAPIIFITGGAPIYEKRDESEAQIYKTYAINHGIPSDKIFIHDGAISVADNVRGGLNAMDEYGLQHDSLILVISWLAMRRAWAHMMKYIDADTKLYRVNASITPGGNFTVENWWRNETGTKTIFNEFGKLRVSEALNSS